MDNRNLIQFPTERVKRKAVPQQADLAAMIQDPRKAGAMLSILSVLLLSFYMNPSVQDGRAPASFGDFRSAEMEKKLENEFLQGARFPASVGREPSTEDRLRVGDLHGRYRLVYRDEYVSEIALIVDGGSNYDPVMLSDRKQFLERYKNIIHPSYDQVVPKLGGGDLRDETFELKKDKQVVGLARIKLDKFGRFYSMKVE